MIELPFTYEDVCMAARECMKGSSWKDSVARWRMSFLPNCSRLYKELSSGKYRQGKPNTFQITSPKHRTVSALLFRDRVVHKLICHEGGLIEDLFRNAFYDNCACQKCKGTSFAISRLETQLRRHIRKHGASGYAIEIDIRHFFDSIPHKGLIDFVYSKVRSPWTRKEVSAIIAENPGDRGIGLGSEVSQVLANAYLTPVDFVCKMRMGVECFVRYADNIVMVVPDEVDGIDGEGNPKTISGRDFARLVMDQVRYAASTLGLDLNPKSSIHPLRQCIHFLGFRWTVTRSGKIVRSVLSKSVARIRRRAKKLVALCASGAITERQVLDSITSWSAYASQGTAKKCIKNVTDKVKEELKCISRLQKK